MVSGLRLEKGPSWQSLPTTELSIETKGFTKVFAPILELLIKQLPSITTP